MLRGQRLRLLCVQHNGTRKPGTNLGKLVDQRDTLGISTMIQPT